MALERLVHMEALKIFRGVASDRDVIVVDEELDVQVLSDGNASSFSVVALLLRTIRTKAEHGLIAVGDGDTVD